MKKVNNPVSVPVSGFITFDHNSSSAYLKKKETFIPAAAKNRGVFGVCLWFWCVTNAVILLRGILFHCLSRQATAFTTLAFPMFDHSYKDLK